MNRKSSMTRILINASAFVVFVVIGGLVSFAAVGKSSTGLWDNQFTASVGQVPSSIFQLAKAGGAVKKAGGGTVNIEPRNGATGAYVEPSNGGKDLNMEPQNGVKGRGIEPSNGGKGTNASPFNS